MDAARQHSSQSTGGDSGSAVQPIRIDRWNDDKNAKHDEGKAELSLVPMRILWDIAEVRAYGNKKYGDTESWRRVAIKRYVDALLRHTAAFTDNWWSVDKESGIRHWKHMACNMAFLSELLHEVEEAMDEL